MAPQVIAPVYSPCSRLLERQDDGVTKPGWPASDIAPDFLVPEAGIEPAWTLWVRGISRASWQ
jgi:hypothetical protein